MAYNQSTPLIQLRRDIYRGSDGGFEPQINRNIAILGGDRTDDPAARRLLSFLRELEGIKDDNIKPLGDMERHRIVLVQEIGGFSLRCIQGMQQLRAAYQSWKGEFITAKRSQMEGGTRELPIPVHIQKEPPFWDIFPEDQTIFQRVLLARALGVLFEDVNQATEEKVIRYTMETVTDDAQPVDIASSWEEATQVLAVNACREDNEEIQRQIDVILENTSTQSEKQALYDQLMAYLNKRATELANEGGKDSQEYKRENAIIRDVISEYKLKVATADPVNGGTATLEDPVIPPPPPSVSQSEILPPPSAAPQPEATPEPVPTAENPIIAKIKKLQELKDLGLLTNEEFETKKDALIKEYTDS